MADLQSLVPNWPPYVVKDLIYKGGKSPEEAGKWLQSLAVWTGYSNPNQIQWKSEVLPIKLELFDRESQAILSQRMGGATMQGARNDMARHQTQAKLVQDKPSEEHIIVIKTPTGYSLREGMHRTIASLKNWPEGYQQQAWTMDTNVNILSSRNWKI